MVQLKEGEEMGELGENSSSPATPAKPRGKLRAGDAAYSRSTSPGSTSAGSSPSPCTAVPFDGSPWVKHHRLAPAFGSVIEEMPVLPEGPPGLLSVASCQAPVYIASANLESSPHRGRSSSVDGLLEECFADSLERGSSGPRYVSEPLRVEETPSRKRTSSGISGPRSPAVQAEALDAFVGATFVAAVSERQASENSCVGTLVASGFRVPLATSVAGTASSVASPTTGSLRPRHPEAGLRISPWSSTLHLPAESNAQVMRLDLSEALPDEAELGSAEKPTVGSAAHRFGTCKPCAFLYTKGCNNGVGCTFCHLCDAGEKKRRQREKKEQRRDMTRWAVDAQSMNFGVTGLCLAAAPR